MIDNVLHIEVYESFFDLNKDNFVENKKGKIKVLNNISKVVEFDHFKIQVVSVGYNLDFLLKEI